jgi:hypothetical protein
MKRQYRVVSWPAYLQDVKNDRVRVGPYYEVQVKRFFGWRTVREFWEAAEALGYAARLAGSSRSEVMAEFGGKVEV